MPLVKLLRKLLSTTTSVGIYADKEPESTGLQLLNIIGFLPSSEILAPTVYFIIS